MKTDTVGHANEALHAMLSQYCRLQVLAPHPDDEVFGAAGLIQQAIAQGLDVRVHIATDGEKCFGDVPHAKEQLLRQARREESMQAARMLGCSQPFFWNLGDGQLSQQVTALQQCMQAQHLPKSLWIAPWFHDGHPDHEAAGQAIQALHLPVLYYPVWTLVDPPRLVRFQSDKHLYQWRLSELQLARKWQAARCFVTQFDQDQRAQGSIIAQQHLVHFVTHYEMYCHGN